MKTPYKTAEFQVTGRSERGQVLILVAVQLLALFGFLGLAIDSGYVFDYRRQMSTAADAAATAGAQELLRYPASTQFVAIGRAASASNAFTHGAASTDVQIFSPPTQGPFAGTPGFVEAIIEQPRPTFFTGLFGILSNTVRARAVAGAFDVAGCILSLNGSEPKAFWVHGNTQVNAPECAVWVNSTHPGAAFREDGNACVTASEIGVTGGTQGVDCSTPTPFEGAVPTEDPLRCPGPNCLEPPPVPPCDPALTNMVIPSGATVTLNPGIYCGTLSMQPSATVTLNPGMYIIAGELGITGANVVGAGVTFYLTQAPGYPFEPMQINSTGTVTLSAPAGDPNDPYEGILFFQDRTVTTQAPCCPHVINGNTNLILNGIIYMPTGDIRANGSSDAAGFTTIIADTIEFGGDFTLNSNYSSLSGGSLFERVSLVE